MSTSKDLSVSHKSRKKNCKGEIIGSIPLTRPDDWVYWMPQHKGFIKHSAWFTKDYRDFLLFLMVRDQISFGRELEEISRQEFVKKFKISDTNLKKLVRQVKSRVQLELKEIKEEIQSWSGFNPEGNTRSELKDSLKTILWDLTCELTQQADRFSEQIDQLPIEE